MVEGGLVAAYRDRDPAPLHAAALILYVLAFAGLLGIVLWRLWTEVLAGLWAT
jgi:hypothetical protein